MVTKRHTLQQVHGGDQSPLLLWTSFVGTGIHDGPVPPVIYNPIGSIARVTHTHAPTHQAKAVMSKDEGRPPKRYTPPQPQRN